MSGPESIHATKESREAGQIHGDVAMVPGAGLALRLHSGQWVTQRAGKVHDAESFGRFAGVRPLIAIDLEDPDTMEAVWRAYYDLGDDWFEPGPKAMSVGAYRMRQALRSLLAPPKPDEPTGLGAVVEDAEGVRWLRRYSGDHQIPWASLDATVHKWRHRDWFEVSAVRVLSSGVDQ